MELNIISELKKLLQKGFFHLFFSNFLIQFMVFGSQMLVAGLLLPEELGRIKVLQTIIDVAAIVGGGGLVVAILKIIPGTENTNKQQFVLKYTLYKSLLFSILVFLILNVIAYFNLLSSDKQINSLFHVFSIVILLSPISLILVRYYQALNKFKKISLIQLSTKIISVIFIVVFTYVYLVEGYILGVVLGFFITLLYLLYDLRKHIFNQETNELKTKGILIKQVNQLSKFNFFAQVSDQLKNYMGLFVANYFVLDREVFGQYTFAFILIQGLNVISSSVQQFVLPKLSKLSINKDVFLVILKKYEKKYLLVSVIVFVVAQLILPIMVDFLFSGKYNASMPFFRVLLIGWLIYGFYTLKGPAFIGVGRLDISFKISITILILITPILIVLCYYYGIWGVIIGYVLQIILNFILTNIYIKKI